MTKPVPLLDLDALALPVGRIKRFGLEHDVLPIDGVNQQMFEQIAARGQKGDALAPGEELEFCRKVVAQVVPSMAEEDRSKLSVSDMLRIITMSGKSLQQVEEWIASQTLPVSESAAGKDATPPSPGPSAAS